MLYWESLEQRLLVRERCLRSFKSMMTLGDDRRCVMEEMAEGGGGGWRKWPPKAPP